MNFYLIAIGFIVRSKRFKILVAIMVALIMIPAMAVVAIAAAPQTLVQEAINGSGTYSTIDPAPTGVAVLGDFTYPGDDYAPGNCTYWVYARRAQVGEPIPNSWGNASTWAFYATIDAYKVDHTPSKYAIMQTPDVDNGLGHVAFVESVDPDGMWHISEMNVLGLYIVDHKAMPASTAANYNFIHTKS
jgi:surface antigen